MDFWGPHQPYFPTQEYYDLYKDMSYPPYASFNSVLEGKPEVYFTEKNVPIGKDNRIVIPNALAWEDYEEMLKCCAAQITMIDEAIGRILNKVKELGMEETRWSSGLLTTAMVSPAMEAILTKGHIYPRRYYGFLWESSGKG